VRRSKAVAYASTVTAGVCSILGGALIAGAWTGEAPKRSGTVVGLLLLGTGVGIGLFQGGR